MAIKKEINKRTELIKRIHRILCYSRKGLYTFQQIAELTGTSRRFVNRVYNRGMLKRKNHNKSDAN